MGGIGGGGGQGGSKGGGGDCSLYIMRMYA